MIDDDHQIKRLARSPRMQRLTLRQAQYLFKSMIISDALFLEHGNVSKAADRLQCRRETINRAMRPQSGKIGGEE